jgi:hypothetical protein
LNADPLGSMAQDEAEEFADLDESWVEHRLEFRHFYELDNTARGAPLASALLRSELRSHGL